MPNIFDEDDEEADKSGSEGREPTKSEDASKPQSPAAKENSLDSTSTEVEELKFKLAAQQELVKQLREENLARPYTQAVTTNSQHLSNAVAAALTRVYPATDPYDPTILAIKGLLREISET